MILSFTPQEERSEPPTIVPLPLLSFSFHRGERRQEVLHWATLRSPFTTTGRPPQEGRVQDAQDSLLSIFRYYIIMT